MTDQKTSKIRVLIVDDIPETRDNLKKLLYFEKDVEVIGEAGNGLEGIKLAQELRPDIVLMDINMPGMDGIRASEKIAVEAPGTQVIMMSVQGEADYLRQSMLAGAREFLIKPFTSDQLTTALRRVHALSLSLRPAVAVAPPVGVPPAGQAVAAPPAAPAPLPKQGKIIAVYSPKGGAGCSTIAANLAIAIKEETKGKVVLMDASFRFGDIGVLLDLQSERTIDDLASVEGGLDEDIVQDVLSTHSSGLKVLLAPGQPERADLIKPEHVKTILGHLQHTFDYVVVDTIHSIDELVLTILEMAAQILLLTTGEIPAIKNTKLFFEICEALHYPPEKNVLILNKADPRSALGVRDIEASIKHAVLTQIEKDERTTTQAAQVGVPFVVNQKNTPIAQSLFRLARLIVGQAAEEAKRPAEVKKAGRLFR